LAADKGNNYIYEMLEKIDPQSAQRIHPSDRKRVIRALEIYHVTGKTITEQNKNSRRQSAVYDTEIYAIDIEREELYRRINERVDKMFEAGLIDEVKHLMDMGVNKSMTSVQGIGYKEVIDYLNGEYTLEETKNLIKQSTRRYAKRQLTWFRKNADIIWIRR
jgi:tRNA dimethylallyltransferase